MTTMQTLIDEDDIDDVDEKVDENQAKDMYKCILKLGQYVQQVDNVPYSIFLKYLNEIDNFINKKGLQKIHFPLLDVSLR